jgi:hypothetical protein
MQMQMENEAIMGLRRPTARECERVTQHIQTEYASKIRFRGRIASALCVAGLVFMGGAGLAGIFVGIVCFVAAFFSVYGKNQLKRIIKNFETGNFYVLDAVVLEITANPDNPGISNVRCGDRNGNQIPGLFRARQEGLAVGANILYVRGIFEGEKHPLERVFTPYMLTDEGIKKHW